MPKRILSWQFSLQESIQIPLSTLKLCWIDKFYDGDDVNVIAADLRLIKTARKTWPLKNMNSEKHGINMGLKNMTY